MSSRRSGSCRLVAAGMMALVGAGVIAVAVTFAPTPRLVTNTTGGKNQNSSIDKAGNLIVFTSNVNHVAGVATSPTGTFDFDNTGNDFTLGGASHPDPACANCTAVDSADGQLFLWRHAASGTEPANSVKQLTFAVGGGFAANQFTDINQNGTVIAWDSDRDHTPRSPGNADGNREIFLIDLSTCTPTCTITQVTNSIDGGDTANRSVNWSDTGAFLVFDSTRDYAGILGCTLSDGVSPCDNSDGNSEIMLYDRSSNTLMQVTNTTGDGNTANVRARISNDGRFIAFQSTRDFSGVLPAGAACLLADGMTACGNDGNGEIMLFDRSGNAFTQITITTNTAPCTGATPNERVEISKRGKFVTWQSKCEAQLNAAGCGSCNGNDEAFVFQQGKGITQVTISDAGFNRVPRVTGSGRYIIFESNRNYKGLNPAHFRTLYIIKGSSRTAPPLTTGQGQLIEDAGSALVQNSKTQVLSINFAGGFNTTVEQFAASTRGRFFAFDNKKGVKNQEIWFLDRNH